MKLTQVCANAPEEFSIPVLFGNNVRKYRKRSGFTQERLAEKLGITQKHLSIIETGTQFVSANLLEKLVIVLKVPPASLFESEFTDSRKEQYESLCSYIDNRFDEYYHRIKQDITALLN